MKTPDRTLWSERSFSVKLDGFDPDLLKDPNYEIIEKEDKRGVYYEVQRVREQIPTCSGCCDRCILPDCNTD